MGNSYLQSAEYDKSIEAYKNAIKLNPNHDMSRYNMAVATKIQEQQQGGGGGGNGDSQQDKDQQNKDKNQNKQKDKSDKGDDLIMIKTKINKKRTKLNLRTIK